MFTTSIRQFSSVGTAVVRSTAASGSSVYESSRAVHEYVQFHFGRLALPHPDLKAAINFPQRCAKLTIDHASAFNSALDLGCAVGGASFPLATRFTNVVGIDFSDAFIKAAKTIQNEGELAFESMESGSIVQKHVAYIDEDAGVRSRVAFQTGDACNLGDELGKFDAILASNLLCRLPQPRKFLLDSKKFLNPKGILVLVSPYSWLDEYTKREEWIGGVTDEAGNVVDSYSAVKSILEKDFELLHKSDMPFLIREHARKYQWGYSDATVWRLKA